MKPRKDVLELFADARQRKSYVKISAPMVRYSKLEFRTLLRHNGVELCFTPMIIADSFCRSDLARQNEFTTNGDDTPLIVQFAAKDSVQLLTAAEMVYPYADGVDLNCGCPQRWAISSGYGCATLKTPELLHDMIRTLKRNLPGKFTASVKMRLLRKDDTGSTVELCRRIEQCGASFITIHGRTPWEKTCEPVDLDAVASIKRALNVPVVANGNIRTLEDANRAFELTQCEGIMAARGLLANPSLYTGTAVTPVSCVEDWVSLARRAGHQMTFQCFHHHLTFMTEKLIRRKQRVVFNNITRSDDVLDFLRKELSVALSDSDEPRIPFSDYLQCKYDDTLYQTKKANGLDDQSPSPVYTQQGHGKFYAEYTARSCEERQPPLQLCSMGDKSLFDERTEM